MDPGDPMEALIKKLTKPATQVCNDNLITKTLPNDRSLMAFPELESANSNSNAKESSNNPIPYGAINFLKIYFDFAFYIFCSPFHFKLGQDGRFMVKTFKPQQIVCALLHLFAIQRVLMESRSSIPDILTRTPEEYFAVIGAGCRLGFKFLTMKRLWLNQGQFLDIVNYIGVEKALPFSSHPLQHKYLITGFCVACTLLPMIMAGSNLIQTPIITSYDRVWLNHQDLVNDGRFAFFVINRTEYVRRFSFQGSEGSNNDTTTALDYVFAIAQGVGLLERLFIGYYFDACLLFGVLTLWCTVQALSKDLKDNDHNQVWTDLSSSGKCGKATVKWADLYKSYKGIRSLSHLINCAYGGMTTTYVAESILYHSMNLDSFVLTKNVLSRMHLLFFVMNSSLTFLFAADICSQMDSLKLWLAKDDNRRAVPLDELNIVLHELNTDVIGIRGSNIFTITYSLVWNMLTTVVTYFIICVQSRAGSKMANKL